MIFFFLACVGTDYDYLWVLRFNAFHFLFFGYVVPLEIKSELVQQSYITKLNNARYCLHVSGFYGMPWSAEQRKILFAW